MPSFDARIRLEEQQAELARALTGLGPPPGQFDAIRIEAAAVSLLCKRERAVAAVWPRLAAVLGERFAERFRAFARLTPLPLHGAALADGRAFVRKLAQKGELPDEGRLEALAVDLRYSITREGRLVRRRGLAVKLALLWCRRCWVAGVRCPGLGERWFTWQWPRSG